jgi:hypothetical protein
MRGNAKATRSGRQRTDEILAFLGAPLLGSQKSVNTIAQSFWLSSKIAEIVGTEFPGIATAFAMHSSIGWHPEICNCRSDDGGARMLEPPAHLVHRRNLTLETVRITLMNGPFCARSEVSRRSRDVRGRFADNYRVHPWLGDDSALLTFGVQSPDARNQATQ